MNRQTDSMIASPGAEADSDVALRPMDGERLAYGDAMRVLGVLAVVVVHACDMVIYSDRPRDAEWWAANFLNVTGRWAVPIFIMLSGALLLHPDRRDSVGTFYRKRLARLGPAIVFWSVFYMLLAVYYTRWAVAAWNPPPGKTSVWRDLLNGRPYFHMHFVLRLAGLYAITPLLRVYTRQADWRLRAGMAGLILGLGVANSVATAFLGVEPSAFASFWSFLGFYLVGNVLREVPATGRRVAWAAVGAAVCWAGIALGTGLLIPADQARPRPYPSVDLMLYDFLSPLRVGLSLCVWFLLAGAFRSPGRRTRKVLSWMAPLTLGVYLVHPLFREILYKKEWLLARPNVWVGVPAAVAVIYPLSLALTFLIRRVPILRRIVG